jgi:hypothetical protein
MAAKNNYPTTIQKILATACAVVLGFNLSGSILAQSSVADRFKDVKYVKTAEKKADEIEGELEIDKQSGGIRFLSKGSELVKVEKPQVTSLLYERTSRPRYVSGLLLAWPLLFTKGKKHFLTIQYKNNAGQGEFALLHLDKSNYQAILAAVEAATGVKVERTID